MANDTKLIPPFVTALYSDSVQTVLKSYHSALHTLWAQVLEAANRDGFVDSIKGV